MQALLSHNCRDPVLFVGSLPCGGVCVAMSCGGLGFTPEFLRFCLGQRETHDWKILRLLLPVPVDDGCVVLLNGWFSSNDDICPDNCNYSRFMLKDKCRSETLELYLYGDMSILVMVSRRAEHCGVLRSWRSSTGLAFLGRVHRYTARVPPPSGRGRGGGDAGSLLPGVLPPELVASYARAWTDTP